MRNLEIIGEAASNIPEDIQAKYNIPWRDIKGFRNFIAHSYWKVDHAIVWDIIENKLNELEESLESVNS